MTDVLRISHQTLKKQHAASDPASSVWVSANAGSGKTHVLAQRVVRLLLQGVAPSKILCLTFTKAAAANMAARVFDTLAAWTRLGDQELVEAILATGAPTPRRQDIIAARKLFARTVETPGGLKIQTIHAFCERLLHLFPFEANVPARFEVADDMRRDELLQRARREILTRAGDAAANLGEALSRIADECSASDFEALIKEAMGHRAMSRARWPQDSEPALRKALGLAPGRDRACIEREMIEDGLAPGQWSEIAAILDRGKKTDQDRARLLRQAAAAYQARRFDDDLQDCLASFLAVFFIEKGEGAKAKSLLTVGLAKDRPDIADALFSKQERLEPLRAERKSAAALDRTLALIAVVDAVFTRYGEMKAARGALDFEDLVARTLALLERSDARWVLYKLDAGIDHILVDEAQDTSAAQWKILERLTGDFTSGLGRDGAPRTFFAVGDEKQSIFSFQGAAPHMFGQMRRKFEKRFIAGAQSFAHVRLVQSFRSAPGVLAAIDKVFEASEHQNGLVAPNDVWMPHEALKLQLPGLVEIWPTVAAEARDDPRDWRLPLDILDAKDPASLVADRIAQKIARLTADGSGEYVHDDKVGGLRPVRAGDIMILVRRRDAFFEAMIRALKRCKVPVAGADRLELGEHIAVMDLIAAGRAALLPQDDLTLACVLKSPLIGLDDDDLLAIAPHRDGSLFDALAGAADARSAQAFAKLSLWRQRTASSPFSFYSRLLGQEGGRRALEARLGPEAGDAIDEFLALALAHEDEAAPSLATFLDDLEGMEHSIRRDMEAGRAVVRVMTVHAAKGLEAKIVFLPDTCGAPSAHHEPKIFALETGIAEQSVIAWSPRRDADCAAIEAARKTMQEATADEYRRLLYVALTRAEERLYIAGFYGVKKPSAGSWAAMIEAALAQDDEIESAPAFWDAEETILRRRTLGGAPLADDAANPPPDETALDAPDWLWRPAAPETNAPPPIRPSSALAAADRLEDAGLTQTRRIALRQGGLMHVLLQYLPGVEPEHRRKAALAFLSARAGDLDAPIRQNLADKALAVIDAPALAGLFGPDSRAEVSVAGKASSPSGGSIEVTGQVDRIAVAQSEVLVADYKTGAPCALARTPAAYLAQMALYRAVLAPLWPDKRLRMLLIWTEGPLAVDLEDAALDAALAAFAAPGERPLSFD
jgi:ATP-dependent helicase/nuclease subunit A